jgi:DNA-binding XRE family transcriptional regulator
MEERTLRGAMADAGISQTALAEILHMARSTLNKKMKTGNFTVREICAISRAVGLKNPQEVYQIFLRDVLQI